LSGVIGLSASTSRNKQELGELYYSRNANAYVYVDSTLGDSIATPDYAIRNVHSLSIGAATFTPNAKIQEAIVYNSDQSRNRLEIEGNINSHYRIYGSNDASQGTASAQPALVNNGRVILENGKPAVEFDGNSTFLRNASITTSGAHNIFSVNKYTSESNENALWDSDTSPQSIAYIDSSSNWIVQYGLTWQTNKAASGTQDVTTFLIDGANSEFWEDGTTQSTGNPGANNISGLTIGATRTNSVPWNGVIQEFILYDSDQDAAGNRTGIETNINTFYNIYS